MKRFAGTKGTILLIIMVFLIVGYYFYLSNKTEEEKNTDNSDISVVQSLLLRDLEKNYPPSPKEVIKYYGEITKCFYDGDYTEDEFQQLAEKVKTLYDDELIANKTDEEYLTDLRTEIEGFKQKDWKISSFRPSSSVDVDYFSEDGFDFARLYCDYKVRQGTKMVSSNHVYLLRKDEAGHYRIYGWDLAENLKNE